MAKKLIRKGKRKIPECIHVMNGGLTYCCNAEVDTSHVIKDGRHKGHGRYYCSNCRRLLFMI